MHEHIHTIGVLDNRVCVGFVIGVCVCRVVFARGPWEFQHWDWAAGNRVLLVHNPDGRSLFGNFLVKVSSKGIVAHSRRTYIRK